MRGRSPLPPRLLPYLSVFVCIRTCYLTSSSNICCPDHVASLGSFVLRYKSLTSLSYHLTPSIDSLGVELKLPISSWRDLLQARVRVSFDACNVCFLLAS